MFQFLWIVFLILSVSSIINCDLVCKRQRLITNDILNCSDSKHASGTNLLHDCFPLYKTLVLNLENTVTLDRSVFEDCTTATNLTAVNGTIEKIVNGTFQNWNNVKIINLSGNKIKDVVKESFLIEQQFYSNVFTIDLSRNQIVRIEDEAFKVLRLRHSALELNLSRNHLTSFNFSSIDVKVLNWLDLSFNNIKVLHPNSKVLVDKLDLSHNSIRDLSSIKFPSEDYLGQLDLAHNDLEKIPMKTFSKLSELRVLNLSFNKLHSLHFGLFNNLSRLATVDLSNNQLDTKSVDAVHDLPRLTRLFFHNNNVTHLDLSEFRKIYMVSFYGNKIKFDCRKLAKDLRTYGYSHIATGPDLDVENVHGIACSSDKNYPGIKGSDHEALIETLTNFTNQNRDLIRTIDASNNWKYEQSKATDENLERYERTLEAVLEKLIKIQSGDSKESLKAEQVYLTGDELKGKLTLIAVLLTVLVILFIGLILFALWKNNDFRIWTRRRRGSIPYHNTSTLQDFNQL